MLLLTGPACRYHQHGRSNGSNEQCLAQLMLFGSFCSGLWHKGSDLDLTITGRWRNRHGQLLDMVSCRGSTAQSLATGQQDLPAVGTARSSSLTGQQDRPVLTGQQEPEHGTRQALQAFAPVLSLLSAALATVCRQGLTRACLVLRGLRL